MAGFRNSIAQTSVDTDPGKAEQPYLARLPKIKGFRPHLIFEVELNPLGPGLLNQIMVAAGHRQVRQ